MQFHKQLYLHNPPETYGDCHRTAYACLLDMDPNEVPNWAAQYWDNIDEWERNEKEWLISQGYHKAIVVYNNTISLDDLMNIMEHMSEGVLYLLTGMSKNGTNHTVICCGGTIIHDPAIDNSGIVGPADNDYYYITYLIPNNLSL